MTTATLPTLDTRTSTDDELHHDVCCNDDIAACGLGVAHLPWVEEGATCPLCQLVIDFNLPCPVPGCPYGGCET